MKTSFEDHFSKQASQYSKYRFGYPRELYQWLASLCVEHQLAWDCACGNGQAAIGLAEFFQKVVATDASADQVSNAKAHERVEYRVCTAEQSTLDDHSVDLVTVAQALHWFDLQKFYAEVKRVLKPGGIIAVWCYVTPQTDERVRDLMTLLGGHILRGYWSNKVRIAEQKYDAIPFPFEEIKAPMFYADNEWTLADLIGYLTSWSGTQTYIEKNHRNPVDLIKNELAEAFGSEQATKTFRWELPMRVGRYTGQ